MDQTTQTPAPTINRIDRDDYVFIEEEQAPDRRLWRALVSKKKAAT